MYNYQLLYNLLEQKPQSEIKGLGGLYLHIFKQVTLAPVSTFVSLVK